MRMKLYRFIILGLVALGLILTSTGCTIVSKQNNQIVETEGSGLAVNDQLSTVQTAQTSSELGLDDLKLAGIKVYDPEDRVRCVLGKPEKTETIKIEVADKECNKLYYQGLIVELLKGTGVARITTQSAKYPTVRGLKVGDTIEKVYELYGQPKSNDNNEIYYSFGKDDFDVFMVRLNDGKVNLVSVYLTN